METLAIHAETRAETGSAAARRLRRSGSIPGVVYGHGHNHKVSVNLHDFILLTHHMQSEHTVITLAVNNTDFNVLIKDISRDTVSHDIEHIDFMVVDMEEIVQVVVQIEAQGEPAGVKNFGGVLELIQREVEVECKAKDIPNTILVDVSQLGVHDVIRVHDLPQLEGARYCDDPEMVVITVAPPTIHVEEEGAEAEVEERLEPEVIGAKPAEEEDKE